MTRLQRILLGLDENAKIKRSDVKRKSPKAVAVDLMCDILEGRYGVYYYLDGDKTAEIKLKRLRLK